MIKNQRIYSFKVVELLFIKKSRLYTFFSSAFDAESKFCQYIQYSCVNRSIIFQKFHIPTRTQFLINAEVFDATKLADLVVKFGTQFHIDPEYIERKTGIPILGIKENITYETPIKSE